jgi:dTDP-4-dehydrorhamnose reductase
VTTRAPDRLARPVLLFGASGQVGRELRPALSALGAVVAPTRAEADLSRPNSLREIIRSVRPSVIVNAAALTNVDRCEHEPDLAQQLNVRAPETMAVEAHSVGAVMVHYSTDYVFDGSQSTPYDETATPNPVNLYGATKLDGERAVAASGAAHLIVRTSWVYSKVGNGFVPMVLRQIDAESEVRAVSDQVGSPTWSRSLAIATTNLLRQLTIGDHLVFPRTDFGVYHLGGSGAASRIEIATELISALRELGWPGRAQMVIPISSTEFGATARRPHYSALKNERAFRRFGIALDNWKRELRRMLRDAT